VRLTLELPRAGEARVEVLDVSGRRVCTLFRGTAPASGTQLVWDGIDERGRKTPGGLYFVRASAGGETVQAKLVRVE
jgi:hypothetical protein